MRDLLPIAGCLLLFTACTDSGEGQTDPAGTTTTATTTGVTTGLSSTGDGSTTAPTTEPTTTPTTTTAPETGTTGEPPVTTEPDTSTTVPDTSTSDTGDTSTGEPVTCPPGFFCEDFEGHPEGAPPGAPWTTDIGDGSAVVESGKSVSGTRAVHFNTGNAYGGRALLGLAVPEVFPTKHLYGRLRMWLTQASPDGVHWTMIEANGPTQAAGVWNDQPFAATIRYGGQHDKRLMANYDTPGFYNNNMGPGSDCWHHSQQTIPEGVWACMEWEFDSEGRTMRFWLDGQEVADLTVGEMGQGCINHGTMDQWYYPDMERMSVGWVDYQDGGARELWIDDVTVGPARVGCE
ncbi:MAG TPA: hypothetical protein VGB85_09500 [Nannocystis sp.]|jgi:hypothetical protein